MEGKKIIRKSAETCFSHLQSGLRTCEVAPLLFLPSSIKGSTTHRSTLSEEDWRLFVWMLNRQQSSLSSQADDAITTSPPPQPKTSRTHFRMQPATMARSKRHTSMTVGLPFRYQHAQGISRVMEKDVAFFFSFFFKPLSPVGSSASNLSVVVAGALGGFLIQQC